MRAALGGFGRFTVWAPETRSAFHLPCSTSELIRSGGELASLRKSRPTIPTDPIRPNPIRPDPVGLVIEPHRAPVDFTKTVRGAETRSARFDDGGGLW